MSPKYPISVLQRRHIPIHSIDNAVLTQISHGPGEGHLDVLVDDGHVLRGDPHVHPGRELEVSLTPRLPLCKARAVLPRADLVGKVGAAQRPGQEVGETGLRGVCQQGLKYKENNK